MVRNGQREGWKEHRPLEASLCSWASPRPSHYGPPDSLLWEIIKSPLLLLLLAELDPSWSVPKPTSPPSSLCILPSSYYKLRKHPPAFFFFLVMFPTPPCLECSSPAPVSGTQIVTPLFWDPVLMVLPAGSRHCFPPGMLCLLKALSFYLQRQLTSQIYIFF